MRGFRSTAAASIPVGARPRGRTAGSTPRRSSRSRVRVGAVVGGWGRVLSAAVTQLSTLLDVAGIFRRVLVDDPGVPGWQLDVVLGVDPGLELSSTFHFGVQLSTEQQRQVGDPEPE